MGAYFAISSKTTGSVFYQAPALLALAFSAADLLFIWLMLPETLTKDVKVCLWKCSLCDKLVVTCVCIQEDADLTLYCRRRLLGVRTPQTSSARYLCSALQLSAGQKIRPPQKVSIGPAGFQRDADTHSQIRGVDFFLCRDAEASDAGPGLLLLPLLVLWTGVHAQFPDSPALPVYKV